jgi:glycerate 2-kinase
MRPKECWRAAEKLGKSAEMVNEPTRKRLQLLWSRALCAVDARTALRGRLPSLPQGRTIIVGAGKAAAAMAAEAAAQYGPSVEGLVVTRYEHGLRAGETSGGIEIVAAGHPLPDAASLGVGTRMLEMVRGLTKSDLVVGLWSGGGSALLEQPLPGVSFETLRAISSALLASGATIGEMNCVRKHLSAIKGGRLAAAAQPARVVSLAISDVPGDDPSVIASGPMVGDPTTQAEARAVLMRYGIPYPAVLHDSAFETPKPYALQTETHIVARQADALAAASAAARDMGLAVLDRGTRIEGPAHEIAAFDARLAIDMAARGGRGVILGGGELAVAGAGEHSGGPNREYALALAQALRGHPAISALAADTDGIDGSDDAAGAFVFPDTLARAEALGLDAATMLPAHDSGRFFAALGDALVTGPTRTNVTDVRALLVQPPAL